MKCEQVQDYLTGYLLGDLDEATRAAVETHLKECEGCRAQRRELELTLDLVRDALSATSSVAIPQRLTPDRRARITSSPPARQPIRALRWLSIPHPQFALAAAACLVLAFVIAGMMLPASLSSREKARYLVPRGSGNPVASSEALLDAPPPQTDSPQVKEEPVTTLYGPPVTPAASMPAPRPQADTDADGVNDAEVAAADAGGSGDGRTVRSVSTRKQWVAGNKPDDVVHEQTEAVQKFAPAKTRFGGEGTASYGAVIPAQPPAPAVLQPGEKKSLARSPGRTSEASAVAEPSRSPKTRRGQIEMSPEVTTEAGSLERKEKMVMADESGIHDGVRKAESPDLKQGGLSIASGSAVVAKTDRTGNDKLALQEPVELEVSAEARGKEAKGGEPIKPAEAHRSLEAMGQRIGGVVEIGPVDPSAERAKQEEVKRLRNVIRQDNVKWAEDTKEVSSSLSTWSLESMGQTKNGDATVAQARETELKAKVPDQKFKVMTEEGQESAAKGSKFTVAPPSDAMAERSVRSDTEKRYYARTAPVTTPRAPAATATEPPQREVQGDIDGYWVSGWKLEKQNEADAKPADALFKAQRGKESRADRPVAKDGQSDGDVRNREINGRVSTATNATLFGATMSYIPVPDQEEPRNLPAKFRAFGVNPFVESASQPFSTFSIDVDTASYTVSRNYMLRGQRPPAEAVRTEEFVNFFDYAYASPAKETFRVYAEAAPSKFGRGLHMLKIGVKGKRVGREEERRAVLTFLVDTSGSMDKPDRIGLIRKSLKMLLDKLSPKDQVAIVQFDSNVRLALDHTPAAEKEKIVGVLDGLQCSGSTHLEGGMTRAYEVAARSFNPKAENRVLILSDGVANLGTMAAEDILAKVEAYRKQGIYCSVFGFGIGTFDDTMLETLANKGNGTYAFIDSETEAKRVFVDDLAATLNTIAADVKIQVEFNPKRVTKYRQLGYENRQLKKEDFRNDAIDAGEVGSGQSVTALYEVEMKDGREVVATVRLRYRRTDNNRVEEVERAVTAADLKQDFDKADARFRLAACAAEFSEQLRGSPHAAGNDFSDVANVLRPVALELPLDQQVQELLRLVQSASSLSLASP